MTKIKTRKALIKRIKVTGTGKLIGVRAFGRHLKIKKSKNQIRKNRTPKPITGTTAKKIKKAMAIA
jgi:large subunit ribosomal protein L35